MPIKHIKKLIEDDGIVFMTYVGVMSQTLLSGMIEALEQEQNIEGIPKKISHNVFTVLIEMTQNIIKYSKSESDDINLFKSNGLILVGKNEEGDFYVHSQNIVSLADKNKITKRIEEIKKLNEDEIKQRYKELRRSAANSHEIGAGIGFYEIAKRAKNITYEFEEINNDKSNFYLTINIK
ncbi:SiaB family protein kinase [Arcobacter sp. s6]|uniref:SiaB family protein kinase n=1 Tax=Arcobacter sp. s6 TaxID=3230363 RepID=UPI0034A029D9